MKYLPLSLLPSLSTNLIFINYFLFACVFCLRGVVQNSYRVQNGSSFSSFSCLASLDTGK